MNEELAKRAVACKRWRWMLGMRAIKDLSRFDGRVCGIKRGCLELALDDLEQDNEGIEWHSQAHSSIGSISLDGVVRREHLPDLDDPATLGCLLALVREAWGGHSAGFQIGPSSDHGWEMWLQHRTEERRWFYGKTEAAVLVAALEAAP